MSASILNLIGGKSSYYNFEVPVSCLSNRRKRNRRCTEFVAESLCVIVFN
jgi:hypothetical protein